MRIIRRIAKIVGWLLLLALIIAIVIAWKVFPAVSGYGAKNMCSAVYLQHRQPSDILKEDLASFPLSLGSFTINEKDSSVTGTVWGFAKRKAIFRSRIGSTLINDFTEAEVRAQQFSIPGKPIINTDTIAWPYGGKIVDSIPASINRAKLNAAVDRVMNETANGKPCRTRAVLVLYDGKIVAEKYAPGFDKNTLMLGWSMSKSITGALTGILARQGKVDINKEAPVKEWAGTGKQKITLKDLLQQSSGLDFAEEYDMPSDVTKMLFSKGDMAAYAASRPLQHQPGTVFNYTSGNTNIISRIIRNTVGETAYAAFPYRELFYKINAYSFMLEPDASGTYIGSSYSYATARDFARFGLLYYNNGVWNGQQILPEGWVKASSQPCPANKAGWYGYQFWINGKDEKDSTRRRFPDVPGDLFFCSGYGGQGIFIIPSKKIIAVRLGLNPIDRNQFLKEVIEAIAP